MHPIILGFPYFPLRLSAYLTWNTTTCQGLTIPFCSTSFYTIKPKFDSTTTCKTLWNNLSHMILSPTRLADPNRVRGARLYTGTFYQFFFLRVELVPVGIQTISVITKIIYIYKRTITGVVSIEIYTHILSPIYIYKNCTFTFTNQSAGHTVMNPY